MADLNSSWLTFTTLAQGASATDALQSAAGAAPSTPAPAATTTAAPGTAPTSVPVGANQPSMWPMMLPLGLLVVMMFVMQAFAGRREKKKRADLMSSMKRGDRVLTIGGIIGTVDQVRDDEVVLKTDPNTSAKMTFTKSSIQQVLKSADGDNGVAPSIEVKGAGERVGAR
jgi:preprotein translocase subunit YajC